MGVQLILILPSQNIRLFFYLVEDVSVKSLPHLPDILETVGASTTVREVFERQALQVNTVFPAGEIFQWMSSLLNCWIPFVELNTNTCFISDLVHLWSSTRHHTQSFIVNGLSSVRLHFYMMICAESEVVISYCKNGLVPGLKHYKCIPIGHIRLLEIKI